MKKILIAIALGIIDMIGDAIWMAIFFGIPLMILVAISIAVMHFL